MPLQIVLREILIMNSSAAIDDLMTDITEEELLQMTKREYLQALIQFALIVVAKVPVLVAYPFVQKYFVRGRTVPVRSSRSGCGQEAADRYGKRRRWSMEVALEIVLRIEPAILTAVFSALLIAARKN